VGPTGVSTTDRLRARLEAMLHLLQTLVEAESPSSDRDGLKTCASLLAASGQDVLGVDPELLEAGGRPHLRWRLGPRPQVGLIGHLDTVWPIGTIGRRPFGVENGQARGPGVFDMKAGLVQGLFAVSELADRTPVEVLVTSDEEVGSPTSRVLIEDLARRVKAVLVLEPSHEGALKVARKGVSSYLFEVGGLAAHAGLEPEKGINAITELGFVIAALAGVEAGVPGTTVTPTVVKGGLAENVVPPRATLAVDVRAETVEAQQRIDAVIRELEPTVTGATLAVSGGLNRPPLERSMSDSLFKLAVDVARRHGLGTLSGVMVGGGSDGNLTAGVGTPTLDGLGAVGGGAHADHEFVMIDEMPARAALVTHLIEALTAGFD
jgi:glutamate carboxypeptidase